MNVKQMKHEEPDVIYLRVKPALVRQLDRVVELDGAKSRNEYLERWIANHLTMQGMKVTHDLPSKMAAESLGISVHTLRRWLKISPEVPVIQRGTAGQKLTQKAIDMLRNKFSS